MRRHPLLVRIIAGVLVAMLVAGLLIAVLAGTSNDAGLATTDADAPTTEPTSSSVEVPPTATALPAPTATETPPPPTPFPDFGPSGLPAVSYTELPPEATDTLLLIDADGPFPFRSDGATFQNREGLLPDEPRGYYQEFTVVTPGSDDRGQLRIVRGANDELYWTSDHYASFSEILDW